VEVSRNPNKCKGLNEIPEPTTSDGKCVAFRGSEINSKGEGWISVSCDRDSKLVVCELKKADADANECPAPYKFQSTTGWCFYASITPRSYADAQSDCLSNDGQLLSIHSQSDVNELIAVMQTSFPDITSIGLGGKLPAQEGLDNDANFQWADNTAFDFSNLQSPYPSRRYGNCLRLVVGPKSSSSVGKMQSSVCAAPMPYVCKQMDPTVSAASRCPSSNYFIDAGLVSH